MQFLHVAIPLLLRLVAIHAPFRLARERKKVGGRQPVTSMLLAGFDVPIYSQLCLEAFVAAFIGAVEEKLGCVAQLMLLQPCRGDKSL